MKRKLLIILLTITFNALSQKPKKIFSALHEGNLIEAQLEYNKISSDNKYNEKEIVLFEIANSLLMIEPTTTSYNPIESIINFNKIFIPAEKKEDIIKFLEKFELDLDKISNRIHSEIIVQAKKINTIESYSNAIRVCLPKYKEELQNLLERKTLDRAKYNLSVNDLNRFIFNYSNSIYNTEAIDFRDSIVLSNVPNEYDAMMVFTKEYPNSKFTKDIISNSSNVLYEESIELNTVESLKRFILLFPNDSRVNFVKQKLSEIKFTEISINKINNLVINCIDRFDVYDFSNGLALVKFNGKWGCINKTGKFFVPIIYDNIRIGFRSEDLMDDLIEVGLSNGKKGYLDTTGKEVIPIIYDGFGGYFVDGVSEVRLNGKKGFIDKKGELVCPLIYDMAKDSEGLFVIVGINGKYGVINKRGINSNSNLYDNIGKFSEGRASVSLNGKYGFIDETGQEVVPLIYDFVYEFSGGLARVIDKSVKFINKTGKVVLINFKTVESSSEGLTIVSIVPNPNYEEKLPKFGFVDKDWKVKVPLIYDLVKSFSEGLSCVRLKGKYGFIDRTGKVIIPIIYDNAESFLKGLAIVNLNGRWGVINKKGKALTPLIYEEIYIDSMGFVVVQDYKNNEPIRYCGYVDINQSIQNAIIYEDIGRFSEGLSCVRLNGKYGFINRMGKCVIPIIYDEVQNFSDGLARVEINGKSGFIDRSGKCVIPLIYDEFHNLPEDGFLEGIARVALNGKWGGIDATGKVLIPLIYDYINKFQDGFARVGFNGKIGCINKSGNVIIPFEYDWIGDINDGIAIAKRGCEYLILKLNPI